MSRCLKPYGWGHDAAARTLVAVMVLLTACTVPVYSLTGEDAPDLPPEQVPEVGMVTWRVTWDNDVVVNSDNQFSNGWSLQVHGSPVRNWGAAAGTPAFGKSMARWFLPDRRDDLYFREGWSVGQAIQTPDDISRKDLIENDVPYAAAIAVQNTWIAYDDRRLYGFGWLMGIVGPAALGEQVQNGFHGATGSAEAMGWDNQLKNEPLINFYYESKWKLVGSAIGDFSVGVGGSLGNLVTAAGVTMEARLGWHVPRGFLYTPDPIGRRLSFDSHLPPQEPTNWAFYGSLAAGVMAFGYSEFYDGNLFHDSHSIDHETFGEAFVVGLHYQRWRWGFHLNLSFSSDVVDPLVAGNEPDPTDNYGTLMIEFRN